MIKYSILLCFLAISANCDNPGILVFGYNGTVYNATATQCSGGVVFKQPVQLEFICASGFYLHRVRACSSVSETIVGSSTFGCQTNEFGYFTQALVLISSENDPSAQTIAFYDNEDHLTGFRKHTFGDPSGALELESEPASQHALVSNPRSNGSVNIGSICYSAEDFDGAVKITVRDPLSGISRFAPVQLFDVQL